VKISGAVCEGVSFCKCKCDKKSGRNISLQDWDHTIVSDVSGMLSPFQGHNNNNNNNNNNSSNNLPKTMQPILPGDFLPPTDSAQKAAILQPNEHEGGARQDNNSPKLPLLTPNSQQKNVGSNARSIATSHKLHTRAVADNL
jgi:hypothetical protein